MPTPLEEELLKQRMGVRDKLGALSGQIPSLAGMQKPALPATPGPFRLNPQVPDPSGLMKAMQDSGIKGQRNEDIELPMSLEELMARAKALEGNRTDFLNSARDVAPSNTSELNRLYDINKGGR